MTYLRADFNNLTCISVDDENADHSSWIVDGGVSFSNDCDLPVYVTIPDANFEQALIDLGIDSDGVINQQILKSDALVVSSLDVSDPENNTNLPNVNAKISDLTGIEAFVNLTLLRCPFNQLTSLDLSQNTKLTELHCWNNQLTSLNVSQNTSLVSLYCCNFFHVVEFQALYFGTSTVNMSDVFFQKINNKWKQFENKISIEQLYADAVNWYIKK